jgi:hypothetical protein
MMKIMGLADATGPPRLVPRLDATHAAGALAVP